MSSLSKRLLDILIASALCIVFIVPIILIAILIKLTSKESVFFWSDRLGQNNIIFSMPKFRTLRSESPLLPHNEFKNINDYITGIGRLLRNSSLDEIPQLYSILKGDMSLVGPRPALPSEEYLIALRTHHSISTLKPGLTGWAQINGRNRLSLLEKFEFDFEYLQKRSLMFDLKILLMTVPIVLIMSNVNRY